MALEKNNLPISISQGLDTKSDPKQIPAGRFTALENAVFLKTGEIRKRAGFQQNLKTNGFPMACSTFKDQLFLLNGTLGYSFSPDQAASSATAADGPFDIGNVEKFAGVPASSKAFCAVDPTRNIALYAYEKQVPNFTTSTLQQKITWSLHDLTTRSKFIQEESNIDGRNPQAVTNQDLDYYIVAYESFSNIVTAGSFVTGTLYEITELGTTNWGAIGYSGTPVVGGRFVATGAGIIGTGGKAGIPAIFCNCVPKDPTLFNSSIFYILNSNVYSGYGFTLSGVEYPKIVYSSGNTGADTSIISFPKTLASLPGSFTPTVLAGTSCRVGAGVAADFGYNMIAMCDGTNVKTIVYDNTLSTVLYGLSTLITAGANEALNGAVPSYLDGGSIARFIVFTTTTTTVAGGSLSVNYLPRIQAAISVNGSTSVAKFDYLLGAAIAGTAFTIDASAFEVTSNRKSYLPVKMIEQFTPNFLSIYDGTYSSFLINFWITTSSSPTAALVKKTVCTKFLQLNTTMTFPYASFATNQYKHFPDYVYFTSGYYNSGSKFYALVPDSTGDSFLYTFAKTDRPIFTEIGNALFVSGGILRMFDGWSFCEHNFLQQPLYPQFGTAGAGSIPGGTYYYCTTYEWRDASGQVHISAASSPSVVTLAASSSNPVICSTLKLTDKNTPVWIGIYRSNDGLLYYKLPNTGVGSNFYNNKNANTLTYTDSISQTFISSQPLLYTVGGEVDNACPPACTFIGTYKRRMIVVPSEDTNSFWYSKEIIPTNADAIGEPVNFALEFLQSVNEEDGKVTGVAEMDDKLIIFKTSGISVVVGNGPAPSGLNNDFSLPQRLATDTGCLYGRSIVLSPLGLIFQSPKGFYLLDRSLSVSYIGAPIEQYNLIECTAANLMYDRNEIWLALQDGKIIIFNYYFNQFSLIPRLFTFGTNQHATIYKGVYVNVAQTLRIETPGIYRDVFATGTGIGYAMKVTTGWLSFAQVQGFQRVYKLLLLGDYKSAHRLQVEVSVDFNDTVVQTSTITADATPPYQYRVFMTRQKCESIKFTIQDLAPTAGTWAQAFSLSNMAFEIGVKRGLNKITAARSVG